MGSQNGHQKGMQKEGDSRLPPNTTALNRLVALEGKNGQLSARFDLRASS